MPLRHVALLLLGFQIGQSDAHSVYRGRSGGHLLRAAGFACRRSIAPAEGAKVFLSAEDAALWSLHVLSNTSSLSYLEWGSGGTTVVAAWRALQAATLGLPPLRVMSIESSPRWRSQLRNRYPVLEQAEANASARLQLESASLEPTGLWGIPMGWTTRPRSLRRQQVLNNSAIPTSLAHSVPSGLALAAALATPFDVIFADGRFRIVCLVRALRLAHAGTIFLVHDNHRLYNNSLAPWFVTTRQADKLVQLQPRPAAFRAAHRNSTDYQDDLQRLLQSAIRGAIG